MTPLVNKSESEESVNQRRVPPNQEGSLSGEDQDPVPPANASHTLSANLGDTSARGGKGATPLPDLLTWLADRRDGFLVAGAALYGLGYLVWSYNAWKSGRGFLPALDVQYFVSGIVPAIIIAVAWAAISFFFRIRDKLLQFTKAHRGWSTAITIFTVSGYSLFSGLSWAMERRWLNVGWTSEQFGQRIGPLIALVLYLQLLMMASTNEKRFRRTIGLYRYAVALSFIYSGFLLYFQLYPKLPQQLGGPEPRCAYVDLVVKGVSRDTLDVLVPPEVIAAKPSVQGSTANDVEVVHSKPLQVFFSSNDYLLVRPPSDETEGSSRTSDTPLYELKKEVIRTITWCR